MTIMQIAELSLVVGSGVKTHSFAICRLPFEVKCKVCVPGNRVKIGFAIVYFGRPRGCMVKTTCFDVEQQLAERIRVCLSNDQVPSMLSALCLYLKKKKKKKKNVYVPCCTLR
jgi:hypothetical protein